MSALARDFFPFAFRGRPLEGVRGINFLCPHLEQLFPAIRNQQCAIEAGFTGSSFAQMFTHSGSRKLPKFLILSCERGTHLSRIVSET